MFKRPQKASFMVLQEPLLLVGRKLRKFHITSMKLPLKKYMISYNPKLRKKPSRPRKALNKVPKTWRRPHKKPKNKPSKRPVSSHTNRLMKTLRISLPMDFKIWAKLQAIWWTKSLIKSARSLQPMLTQNFQKQKMSLDNKFHRLSNLWKQKQQLWKGKSLWLNKPNKKPSKWLALMPRKKHKLRKSILSKELKTPDKVLKRPQVTKVHYCNKPKRTLCRAGKALSKAPKTFMTQRLKKQLIWVKTSRKKQEKKQKSQVRFWLRKEIKWRKTHDLIEKIRQKIKCDFMKLATVLNWWIHKKWLSKVYKIWVIYKKSKPWNRQYFSNS